MDNTLKTLYVKAQENKIRKIRYLGCINDHAICLEIEYTDEKRNLYSILSKEFWSLGDQDFKEISREVEKITGEIFIRLSSGNSGFKVDLLNES